MLRQSGKTLPDRRGLECIDSAADERSFLGGKAVGFYVRAGHSRTSANYGNSKRISATPAAAKYYPAVHSLGRLKKKDWHRCVLVSNILITAQKPIYYRVRSSKA